MLDRRSMSHWASATHLDQVAEWVDRVKSSMSTVMEQVMCEVP